MTTGSRATLRSWVEKLLVLAMAAALLAFPAHAQDVRDSAAEAPIPPASNTPAPDPAPGAAPADNAAPPTTNGNNILHIDDLIRITVFQESDLTTETRITKAGSITFPLIGTVQVAGKTISQTEEQIRALLDKDYIVNPHVTVAVIEYSKAYVTVLGQVQKPGNVEMPNNGGLDLLGAIALAGGYTTDADMTRVAVRRIVNGAEQVTNFNVTEMSHNSTTKPFMVQPGDAVTIPSYIKKWVTVLGEVQKPGRVDLPQEGTMDVLGALAMASGYTADADPTHIDIRRNVDGRDSIITVNATELAQNSSVRPVVLEPGDSITVHYNRQWVTILGEVQKPGKVKIPPEGGLDLLGAIALASGFNADADIAHISVRRTVDGKDMILNVNAKELSRNTNVNSFLVLPGDNITVPQRMF
jgi:protein involved in polysaccharide export with SLBB domain